MYDVHSKKLAHAVLSGLVSLGWVGTSYSAPERAGSASLEEIIVTAQKRSQSLEEVPLSIQAFTGDALEQSNIRDFSELITFVPGASEGLSLNAGTREYQIRGIAQGSGDPTVGYYVDDAAFFLYGVSNAPMGRTFDMERVEVLRGPQSTLFGNGSMGGTVRFITNKPNLEAVEGQVAAGYSSTDGGDPGYHVDGAISIPLIEDELGVRLVASYENIGGYHRVPNSDIDDFNEADVTNLQANVLWTPTERLTMKLLYLGNEIEQDGGSLLASLDPPIGTALDGDHSDTEYDLLSGTLVYDFDSFSLTSTFTGIDYTSELATSLAFPVPGGILLFNRNLDGDAFNNETRLVSTGDGPLQWIAGVFYSDTDVEESTVFVPALSPESVQVRESESLAVFGEVSWSFLNDTLVPLVGLRYFEDDRESTTSTLTQQVEPETFDSWNPRFNLSWFPDENAHYYLNIAKGFRSGNFNNPDIIGIHAMSGLPSEVSVDSDELWSYEIGSKLSLAEGQLSLDLALYFQDLQDSRQYVPDPIIAFFQDYQVGDAESYGIDVGVVYAPQSVEGLTLRLAGNWNSSEWTDIRPEIEAATGRFSNGDPMPLVPEWTLAVGADYFWQAMNDWEGLVSLSYNSISSRPGQSGANAEGDERNLLRARLGIENERWGVYLFGKNLLGEDGSVYSQAAAGGATAFTQDYPRQLGIEARMNF